MWDRVQYAWISTDTVQTYEPVLQQNSNLEEKDNDNSIGLIQFTLKPSFCW